MSRALYQQKRVTVLPPLHRRSVLQYVPPIYVSVVRRSNFIFCRMGAMTKLATSELLHVDPRTVCSLHNHNPAVASEPPAITGMRASVPRSRFLFRWDAECFICRRQKSAYTTGEIYFYANLYALILGL